MPLSTAACKARLAQNPDLIRALVGLLEHWEQQFKGTSSPADQAMAGHVYKAALTLTFNMTFVTKV